MKTYLLVLSLLGCAVSARADVGSEKGAQGLQKLQAGDCAGAYPLLKQAEAAGDACSRNNLGIIIASGCPAAGVARDQLIARGKFEYAATLGCTIGYVNAGDMYANGDGAKPDATKAIEWYYRGAAWGDATAAERLRKLGVDPPPQSLMREAAEAKQRQKQENTAAMAMAFAAAAQGFANAHATTPQHSGCNSDLDCGIGKVCVRASQQIGIGGTCVVPVNSVGTPLVVVPRPGVTKVGGCSFDTQCGVGFRCQKQSTEIYGICVK